MSLVGSLEDLGLGDILQIVSLSRKSGILNLRAESGTGSILLRDGLVCAATLKGGAEDLRALVVGDGFVSAEAFDAAEQCAAARGGTVAEALAETTELTTGRLDSLRREHVERVVLQMFRWQTGEFSFEIRDEFDDWDNELRHPTGINAQYLAMEATRLGDECGHGDSEAGLDERSALGTDAPDAAGDDDSDPAEGFSLGGWDAADEPEPSAERDEPGDESDESAAGDPHHVLALATASREEPEVGDGPVAPDGPEAVEREVTAPAPDVQVEAPAPAPLPAAPALVVIDPDLNALEWLKSEFDGDYPQVHIFQRSDGGVARVRQYLRRGELPRVLISAGASGDPLTGSDDLIDLVRRLRVQAPGMSIVVLYEEGSPLRGHVPAADALVPRPASSVLADAAAWGGLTAAADRIRNALEVAAQQIPASDRGARAPLSGAPSGGDLERLREWSARLRDPSTRGEVLSLVLEFAAQTFSRVAIFMLRDDSAIGVAQRGLDRAGGPGDPELRKIEIQAEDPAWFREVIRSREARIAPPANDGDRWLAALLGDSLPDESYLAPIESGDRIAALLYGDNLPERSPIGDTRALEGVLHEAGLALDRALLERALAAQEA